MKAYLANGIFGEGDRLYNAYLAKKIRAAVPDIDLYLPQENAEINDKSQFADSVAIAKGDNERLEKADVLLVVLDNLEAGQGRCAEIGYAAGLGIPIIGLWTDTRQEGADNAEKIAALSDVAENQFMYVNLYVIGLVKLNGRVVNNIPDFVAAVKELAVKVAAER